MAVGIEIKKPEQILVMRRAGLVVARTLAALRDVARAGLTTVDLDRLARDLLAEQGATSSFLNYGAGFGVPPFPAVVGAVAVVADVDGSDAVVRLSAGMP